MLIRRLRRKPESAPEGVVRPAPAMQLAGAATSMQAPRRTVTHNGRRRRSSRGLHR